MPDAEGAAMLSGAAPKPPTNSDTGFLKTRQEMADQRRLAARLREIELHARRRSHELARRPGDAIGNGSDDHEASELVSRSAM